MTIEDINDPKWVAYDHKKPKRKKSRDKTKQEPDPLVNLPAKQEDVDPDALEDLLNTLENTPFDSSQDDKLDEDLLDLDDLFLFDDDSHPLNFGLPPGWDIVSINYYEKFYQPYLIRVTFTMLMGLGIERYIIVPRIMTKNPDYDPKDISSLMYIEKSKGQDFSTGSLFEAEEHVTKIIKKYDKIFGDNK